MLKAWEKVLIADRGTRERLHVADGTQERVVCG